jgi:hypothetical protein
VVRSSGYADINGDGGFAQEGSVVWILDRNHISSPRVVKTSPGKAESGLIY